jgi:hypothetical protein
MFLGISQQHTSEIMSVLNLGTRSITIQFHVVFDDLFTAVPSIERETALPDNWAELCLENQTHIMLDTMQSASNSVVPTTSTDGENYPTEGALPSPSVPELRRSTHSTSGKFIQQDMLIHS